MGEDSKEMRSQEGRRWIRLECRVPIHYRIDTENTFNAGLARDISEAGVKFKANRQIPLRTILRLAIQLPLHTKPLKTRAEVVSACKAETDGSYEVGVRFLDLRQRVRDRITHYIDEITSEVEGGEEKEADRERARALEERENLTVADNRRVKTKGEKEQNVSALIEEIEALKMIINEEERTCRLGKLATLSFHELKGCPPLMLGLKFKEAVMEPLLKKHGLNEKEMKKVVDECKKKFKALGTKYYIHTLKGREG